MTPAAGARGSRRGGANPPSQLPAGSGILCPALGPRPAGMAAQSNDNHLGAAAIELPRPSRRLGPMISQSD